jgi:surfeit locus 1 family protein
MTRRNVIAALLAIVVAGVCFRLGVWQLDRLAERRARNAIVEAGMRGAPVEIDRLATDSTIRYRLVRILGAFDYAHELVLSGRSRDGSPGVYIVTPVRLGGSDTAVLVNRGWVYSPDASTVDLGRWREGPMATLTGYVVPFESGHGSVRAVSQPTAWRRLDADTLAAVLPYPVKPFSVVALPEGTQGDSVPVRLARPVLDEGPHTGYAVQWFSFGTIALVGVSALIWQDVKRRRAGAPPA